MSGAEAVLVISVASNVVQFIESGSKLYNHIKEISTSVTGTTWRSQELADRLSQVLETLKRLNISGRSLSEHEQKTLESSLRQAEKLDTLLESFRVRVGKDSKSKVEVAKKAWKSMNAEKKIQEFQQGLNSLLGLLSFQVLIRTADAVDDVRDSLRGKLCQEKFTAEASKWNSGSYHQRLQAYQR